MNLTVYRLKENGLLEEVGGTFRPGRPGAEFPCWIRVQKPERGELEQFLAPFHLHPLVLEGCLEPARNSRIVPFEQSLFLEFPTQSAWDDSRPAFLSMVCLAQALITIEEEPIPVVAEIAADYAGDMRLHGATATALVYQVLDRLIDHDLVFAVEARRQVDRVEARFDEDSDSLAVAEILALKRRVAHLSITCEDQVHCLAALQTAESRVFRIGPLREYFRDAMGHLDHALRSIARLETRLAELHQHYLLTLQDRAESRLRLLTIVSAIFLPLSLITGIYGMNFRNMPELGWTLGYPTVLAVMVIIAWVMLWVFHTKGWFR